MKPVQLLALFLATACAQAPAQNNQGVGPKQALRPDHVVRPDVTQDALMDRIEREVRLPPGADPLSSYARSYAWHQGKDGTRTVAAYYESLTGDFRGRRRWTTEREFPLIADGGCGVVTFSYDPATGRFENISCNGYA